MDIAQKRRRTLEHLPGNQGPLHNNDGIDHISNLPTEVICHILSFLPTKNVVRTSVLSTKWKKLLPWIPDLKIELEDQDLRLFPASDTSIINFKNFVDRLLNVTLYSLPNVPPSVFSFSLDCSKINDGQEIAKWIAAALKLNIKMIKLRVCLSKNSDFLLASLFGANIITLFLSLDFSDDFPEFKFSLPNLKTLAVQGMRSDAINVLLETCPVLQKLTLCCCYCSQGGVFHICKPSLRSVEFITNRSVRIGEFLLNVPNLECLVYQGFLPRRFSAKRLEFLQSARFYLDESCTAHPEPYEPTSALIKACANVEKLSLSGKIIRLLCDYPHLLPRFERLLCLIMPKIDSYGWELLPKLLDSAPSINTLVLESGFDHKSYKDLKASVDKSFSICLTRHGQTCYNLVFGRKATCSATPDIKTSIIWISR